MSRVSIVIPAFNQAAYLAQAVESAVSQTHADVEVVVVDDGSTDRTPEVCARLSTHPRVRVVRQANAGVGAARNRGLTESTGDYVCFLDADDFYRADKVAKQAAVLDAHPSVGFVYCDIVPVDERGEPSATTYSVGASRTSLHGDILESLLLGGYFPPHVVMIRRSVLDEVGAFDPSLGGNADLDLWMRAAASGVVAEYLDEPLAFYRSQPDGMSRDSDHMRATRIGALSKLAAGWPERVARGISRLQEVGEDLHAANQWLHESLERALADLALEAGRAESFIDAAEAGGGQIADRRRLAMWGVTVEGSYSRALMLHPTSQVTFEMTTGAAGQVTGAVMLHPDVWDDPRSGSCRFEVTVDDRIRWTCLVDPRLRPEDRGWLPFALDVPVRASGPHHIVLETAGIGGDDFRWALWREPRFVQAVFSSQKLQPHEGCTPL